MEVLFVFLAFSLKRRRRDDDKENFVSSSSSVKRSESDERRKISIVWKFEFLEFADTTFFWLIAGRKF